MRRRTYKKKEVTDIAVTSVTNPYDKMYTSLPTYDLVNAGSHKGFVGMLSSNTVELTLLFSTKYFGAVKFYIEGSGRDIMHLDTENNCKNEGTIYESNYAFAKGNWKYFPLLHKLILTFDNPLYPINKRICIGMQPINGVYREVIFTIVKGGNLIVSYTVNNTTYNVYPDIWMPSGGYQQFTLTSPTFTMNLNFLDLDYYGPVVGNKFEYSDIPAYILDIYAKDGHSGGADPYRNSGAICGPYHANGIGTWKYYPETKQLVLSFYTTSPVTQYAGLYTGNSNDTSTIVMSLLPVGGIPQYITLKLHGLKGFR